MGTAPLNNWRSIVKSARWFFSPHLDARQKRALAALRRRSPRGPLWVLSSGTQSIARLKAIGLTEEAVLCSADAVNRHLASSRADRWLLAIPAYHIGGLSIFARAHLSGAVVRVANGRWNAKTFEEMVAAEKITLTSLVPTQVYDLVAAGLRAPPSLRAAVIGGGQLEPELYLKGRSLGWPLLPSYGLTECASQVATAPLDSLSRAGFPGLEVLRHVEVDTRDGRVFLRSAALCDLIATATAEGEFSLEFPVRNGWFATQDLARLNKRELIPLGRVDDVVKILGVLVPLSDLERQVRGFFKDRGIEDGLCVAAVADARHGSKLVLFTETAESLHVWDEILAEFNRAAPGPRRIKDLCWIPRIPRTDLGKVKRAELSTLLALSTSRSVVK